MHDLPHTIVTARVFKLFVLGLSLAAATGVSAGGDGSRKTKRQPPHLGTPAPDVTGTIAPPPATSPPPEDMTIPAPYTLPAASRERYRACGATWRDMKLAGKTGDDDWREFAEKCLVQKDEAPPRR